MYPHILTIFTSNMGTFFILSFLQVLAYIPVVALFLVIVAFAFGSEATVMYSGLSQAIQNGGRRLYESAYNYGGTNNYSSNYDDSSAIQVDGVMAFIETMGWLFLLTFVVITLVRASFQGAFIRATAEIYAGRTPNWQCCLQVGYKKACSVACFGLLYLLAAFALRIIYWLLLAVFEQSLVLSFVAFCLYHVAVIILMCAMVGGLPCIMVEDKSAVLAMKRSWEICRKSLCPIFLSIIFFYGLEILGFLLLIIGLSTLSAAMAGGDPNGSTAGSALVGIITLVVFFGGAILIGPFNATLNPVIYFGLRIRDEGLTMELLQQELHLMEGALELRTKDGVYGKVGTPVASPTHCIV